ncbi:hypothetical protein F5B22DRAFT_613000 [Xylaria bambusicola]|uniref:uncharacterized protein n=1 Tax=Xylaria bambusicola TaxID=326684 RepID=UPI0020082F56|nr:uncharacterized protein F5B22DRAFT_613000 [Xylaria bambusicola]KAI0513002.1 hypothetical protein F5B22DRAFT_613000 [Xylaria bambusicola]
MHAYITILRRIFFGAFTIWPLNIYMIGGYLGPALFLILYPISFFDADPLQWLYSWFTSPEATRRWVFSWLLGLISELIYYVGWLCSRVLRGQQTNSAEYIPLALKVLLLIMSLPLSAGNYSADRYMALQSDQGKASLRQDGGNYQEKRPEKEPASSHSCSSRYSLQQK